MPSTKKIKYGKKDVLTEDDFDPKNGKFRVTMFIDLDVLDELRKRAARKGLPYQTYINQTLRELTFGSEQEDRVREIVRDELKKRVRPA